MPTSLTVIVAHTGAVGQVIPTPYVVPRVRDSTYLPLSVKWTVPVCMLVQENIKVTHNVKALKSVLRQTQLL